MSRGRETLSNWAEENVSALAKVRDMKSQTL